MQTLNSDCGVDIDTSGLVNSSKKEVIRVLHVDDDPSILEITKQIMVDMDNSFEFDCACNVDEAFKKLSTEHYDVVISDYEMPQKNGLQFLTQLREQNNTIPFILFTGKGREEIAIQALNLGADGYHNKQGSPETIYGELAHGIRSTVSRRKTEEALKASEKSYHDLINGMNDTVWVIGFDGKFLEVNDTAIRVLGYSREELLSMGPLDIDSNLSREQIKDFVTRMPSDQVQVFETAHTTKNGKVIPVEISSSFVTYQGKPAVLSIARDISERKKTEATLLASEEKYRVTFESTGTATVIIEEDTTFSLVNSECEKLTGYSKEELEGKKRWTEFVVKEDLERMKHQHLFRRFDEKAASSHYEFRFINRYGEIKNILLTIAMIPGTKKTVASLLDVSEPKKAEEALRESEEKHRKLFEGALDAIFLADVETGILVDCNPAAIELVGREKSEIIGQHQRNLHPKHEIEGDSTRVFKQHIKQDDVSEAQVITKTGEIKDVSIKSSHVVVGGRKMLQGVFRDVTESKKAQRALLVSEEKYRETIQNANVGIVAYHPNGKITILNPTMQKMIGYTIEEIPNLSQWFGKLYPNGDERQKIKDKWFKKLTEVGEVKEGQATIITKQGEQRIFLFDGFRLHSGDFIAFARDITYREKAEETLKQTMDKLVLVNEKLGVVGGLTRHDVRNKLSAVTTYAYLLKKKHADQADIVEGLGKMEQAIMDSMRIFEFAKMYEQIGVEELKYVNVEKTLNEAESLFSGLNIKVVNDCQGLTVMADSFLRQLFYNLIDNTRKYGKKTTAIRVYFEKMKQGELRLIYEDDGVGISVENKLNLFSEGFSTGGSTGFGLFLIRKMMDVYGWTIIEEGETGKGAKFVLSIPANAVSGLAREASV